MQVFKKLDLIFQLLISLGCLALTAVFPGDTSIFITWLALIGCWQVISFIVHLAGYPRRAYRFGRILYSALLTGVAVLIATMPSDQYSNFLMNWMSPAMAALYFAVCCWETARRSAQINRTTVNEIS